MMSLVLCGESEPQCVWKYWKLYPKQEMCYLRANNTITLHHTNGIVPMVLPCFCAFSETQLLACRAVS